MAGTRIRLKRTLSNKLRLCEMFGMFDRTGHRAQHILRITAKSIFGFRPSFFCYFSRNVRLRHDFN